MFCDQCGARLDSGAQFCNRCGKKVKGPVTFAAPRPNRVQAHVRLLGILWLALSAFDVIAGLGALIVARWIFGPDGPAANAPVFIRPLVTIGGLVSLGKAALGFAAGSGLLNRQPWARSLAIVVGVISLFFQIPFGTALGVYTLWVLLPQHSEEEYERYQSTAA